jgi:putative effector of murein hydrolase LrgA (UPF0299 family)
VKEPIRISSMKMEFIPFGARIREHQMKMENHLLRVCTELILSTCTDMPRIAG